MERVAFKMRLKPGVAAEYKRCHDAIWPELEAALREAGISDYGIYLDHETQTLFALQKRSRDHRADLLPQLPIMQRWWAYTARLMETHPASRMHPAGARRSGCAVAEQVRACRGALAGALPWSLSFFGADVRVKP